MSVGGEDEPASLETAWLVALRAGAPAAKGDIVDDLRAIFVGDVPERLRALRAQVAQGDATKARATAHRIKGSSGTIRAMRLASLAEQVELRASRGRLDEVTALLDAMDAEVARVTTLLAGV